MEKHHIIFKSQQGMDFDLNYKYLDPDSHRGNLSPHKNKKIDLQYKEQLEQDLREVLPLDYYSLSELILILGLDKKQATKAFKRVSVTSKGISKESIIFQLMGGCYYLMEYAILINGEYFKEYIYFDKDNDRGQFGKVRLQDGDIIDIVTTKEIERTEVGRSLGNTITTLYGIESMKHNEVRIVPIRR